jgi:hypothetical protein
MEFLKKIIGLPDDPITAQKCGFSIKNGHAALSY